MSAASVERFWCPREGAYALDDHGFLRDPDATWFLTHSANPDALWTDDLRGYRCLVLLGEPGAGKSTAASGTAQLVAVGMPVVSFDLVAYGSEDRLVREVFDDPTVTAWSAGTGELCLVLDSLDAARARAHMAVPSSPTVCAGCRMTGCSCASRAAPRAGRPDWGSR